jgi:CDP-diacylglycerol pyrophosphatase
MAMNARWNHEKKPSRGHDQLHIHVSCIQKGVQTTLDTLDGKGQIATKPEDWGKSVQPIPAGGPNYRLLRQDENVLSEHNLFKFLFEVLKKVWGDETKAAANMPYQTLVVAKRKAGGFYILNSDDRITLTPGTGHGEDLLDKQCS